MGKWNIFKRSKKQEKNEPQTVEIIEDEDIETTHIYTEEEPEENIQNQSDNLAEYDETLNTNTKPKTFVNKDKKTEEKEGYIEDEIDNEQRHWRDINTIEKKIDELHITKAKKPKTDVEKTVDTLIEKNKKKQ